MHVGDTQSCIKPRTQSGERGWHELAVIGKRSRTDGVGHSLGIFYFLMDIMQALDRIGDMRTQLHGHCRYQITQRLLFTFSPHRNRCHCGHAGLG